MPPQCHVKEDFGAQIVSRSIFSSTIAKLLTNYYTPVSVTAEKKLNVFKCHIITERTRIEVLYIILKKIIGENSEIELLWWYVVTEVQVIA